jgi:hypothetical protein
VSKSGVFVMTCMRISNVGCLNEVAMSRCFQRGTQAGLFMNTCSVVRSLWAACRSSRPAWLFSFGLLNGLQVHLCRSHLREALAGFGAERRATAFMNNPG